MATNNKKPKRERWSHETDWIRGLEDAYQVEHFYRKIGKSTVCLDMQDVEDLLNTYEIALEKIATIDDKKAWEHLENSGTYGWFDNPEDVKIAREALGENHLNAMR